MQTGATTPNITPTTLGFVACVLAQVWDLQCIVGRIQPISLRNPCVMSVRGLNNVGRALQTDPTLLRYASAITEQKKCWMLLAKKSDRFQTLRNNMQQGVQTDATCNIRQCWELLANNVAFVCKGLEITPLLFKYEAGLLRLHKSNSKCPPPPPPPLTETTLASV